jgi:hypothetical protein
VHQWGFGVKDRIKPSWIDIGYSSNNEGHKEILHIDYQQKQQ